jgi:hypothetical protein
MATTSGAVRAHHTDTSGRRWDGSAVERRLPDDDVRMFRRVYAWVDPTSPENKTAAKFPHHEVTRDGSAGAANVRALINGIAILNGGRGGADLDDSQRRAVYRHLATHLRDAGRDPAPLK